MFSTPVTNYRSIPVDVLTNLDPAWTRETFTQRGHRHEYFSERPDMSLRHCVASRGMVVALPCDHRTTLCILMNQHFLHNKALYSIPDLLHLSPTCST